MFWNEKITESVVERVVADGTLELIIHERIDDLLLQKRKKEENDNERDKTGEELILIKQKLNNYIAATHNELLEKEKEYFYKKGKETLTELDERIFEQYKNEVKKNVEISNALLTILNY